MRRPLADLQERPEFVLRAWAKVGKRMTQNEVVEQPRDEAVWKEVEPVGNELNDEFDEFLREVEEVHFAQRTRHMTRAYA